MSDLNTEIRLRADATGVEAGVSKAKRSLRDLADAARSTGDGVASAGDKASRSLAGMGDGGEAAARKIQRDTSAMRGNLQRYLATLEAGSKDSRKYWETMADFKGVDKNALRPLLDQLDAYKAKTKDAQESTASWFGSLSKIGATAAGVAALGATAGMAAKAMFDASASAERLRTMLDFSTGGNSAKEIEYLRGITYRLGLEFSSTAKAYGQFSAAAKGTALEGDKARAVFESVAKASAVMGLSAADTGGVLLALQQMISKGTVQAEELRGQLGERLPGAFQIAAKAMGVTTGELGKMLEQGQVIADDFLPKFAAALDKNIGAASEKAAQRLDASVNRVATAWDRLKQNGGDSGVSSFMAGQYEILADAFNGVSEAMERARGSGSGFVGQMAAGAVAAAKFANPLQAVSYSAIETGNALKQAEAEFAALQKRGDVMGGNIYYKAEMANLAALIKELKAAQAEKQKLATGVSPNMNEGVTASGRAREQYMNQRAKDEEAANKFRLNLAGVPGDYIKDMNELIRLNQAGIIVGKEYTDALKKQQDELLKKTGATKASNAAANQELTAYESLVASIRTKIAANEAEIQGGGRLTESDRLRIKLQEELDAGSKKLTASHKARALALLDVLSAQEKEEARIKGMVAAYKEEAETAEELARAYVEQSKAREAGRAAVDGYVNGIDEANKTLQLELSLMGLGERARNVALEQYRIELDLKKQIAAVDSNSGFENEAQREEERARLRAAAAIATANASSRAFLEEWKTSVGKYDDIFRQGFADMLNNGKDGWKSFTRSLATTFKTTVADQLYKAFAQPFVVNIVGNLLGLTGSLGASAVGGVAAAASGGSALGTVGNLASGAGMLGRLGSGFANGLSAWGSGGSVTGVLSNPGLYTGAELAGALAPIALGIGALVAIANATKGETRTGGQFGVAFDGSVTNQRRGQTYTVQGQQFDRDFTGGASVALTNGQAYRLEGDPVAQESAIRKAVAGTAESINSLLEKYGSTAALTGFSAGLETSGKGRGGVFAGGLLSTGAAFGESGKGDNYAGTLYEKFSSNSPDFKTALENFTLDLQQATLQALQAATDLPAYVSRVIKDVDVESLGAEEVAKLLGTLADLPNVLLSAAGTSRDALVLQFTEGLAKGDAAKAGQDVANTLVDSIETALYTNAAGKIFDVVNNGIIAPVIDAITTGASVSEALSSATVEKTIERAKAQASALSELFSNAEFAAALESIRTTVGTALGQAGSAFGYTPKFQVDTTKELDDAAKSAADAAEAARKKWQDITDGLLGDRAQLDIDLLRAQGREEAALSAERLLAIDGYDAYQTALYDGNKALRDQITELGKLNDLRDEEKSLNIEMLQARGDFAGAMALITDGMSEAQRAAYLYNDALRKQIDTTRAISSELPGVIDKFLSPAQRESVQYQRIAGSLNEAGIGVTADALMSASKDQIASVALQVYNLGTTSDETRLAILRAASGLADLKDAANAANIASADTAYAALERAVTKQRGILEETVADVREVFDAVRTASRELFGEVEGAAAMQARAGRKFISDALSSAKLTGYLPDGKDLQEAIGAARAGIGASVYASQADADYERLVLANELRDLQGISGDQLTEAEKQIKALDSILDTSKAQLDALKGIDSSVLSVAEALSGFRSAMGKAGGGTAGAAGTTITNPVNGKSVFNGLQGAQFDAASGTGYLAGSGLPWNVDSVRAEAEALLASGQNAAVIAAIKGQGYTHDQAEKILGIDLPQFRIGTNYVPRDMAAIVHEGEAIVPKAYNPAAGGVGGNSSRVEALLEGMAKEIQRLQAIVSDGNNQQRRTANAVNGTPEMPMVVAIA